jgi:hypothetical protein
LAPAPAATLRRPADGAATFAFDFFGIATSSDLFAAGTIMNSRPVN